MSVPKTKRGGHFMRHDNDAGVPRLARRAQQIPNNGEIFLAIIYFS